jgi:phage shock protein PspC (stress-responsive transcriptional regulator)
MPETPPRNPHEPTPGDPLTGTPPAGGTPPPTGHTEQQPPPPKKFMRSGSDRMIGGVAGGLARHLEIDPLLVRIVLAVLTIAFPPTLIGYVAALVLVPTDGAPVAPPENRNRIIAAVVVGGLLLFTLPFLIPFGFIAGPPLLGIAVPLVLLGGIVWVAVRVLNTEGAGSGRRIGAAIGIVLLAITGFFAALAAAVLGAGWVVAAIVIVCGIALMGAAFAGGARWLLAPALLLALPLAGVAAADVKLDGGVGEREYRPASVQEIRSEYQLGVGQLTLDLRDVDFPSGDTRVRIDLGIGEARVIVPQDVCVSPRIEIGAGEATIGERQQNGVGVDWEESTGATGGGSRLILEADLGLGEIRVGSGGFGPDGFDNGDLDLQDVICT